jgi:hypothetical protein
MMDEAFSIHASSLEVNDFRFAVQQLDIEAAVANETGYFTHDFVRVAPVVGDEADAQGSRLPAVVIVNLSHGDIVPVLELTGHGFEHLPLALEGCVLGQAKPDCTDTNIHGRLIRGIDELQLQYTGYGLDNQIQPNVTEPVLQPC